MSDVDRLEAGLRTFIGMAEIGCRKATGKSLEQFVQDQADGGAIFNDVGFIFACSLVCMKGVLDGEDPAHGPACTIWNHPMFDLANCTCGVAGKTDG